MDPCAGWGHSNSSQFQCSTDRGPTSAGGNDGICGGGLGLLQCAVGCGGMDGSATWDRDVFDSCADGSPDVSPVQFGVFTTFPQSGAE